VSGRVLSTAGAAPAPGSGAAQRQRREGGFAGVLGAFGPFPRRQRAIGIHLPDESLVGRLARRCGAGRPVRCVRPRRMRRKLRAQTPLCWCQIFPHDHHQAIPGVTTSTKLLVDTTCERGLPGRLPTLRRHADQTRPEVNVQPTTESRRRTELLLSRARVTTPRFPLP
jgi:hypothetical protein